MRTRRIAQLVAAVWAASGVAVSSASDLVEARPGAMVRVTTARGFDQAGLPAAEGCVDQQDASSPAGGTSVPAAGPTVLGRLVEIERDAITVLRESEKDRVRIPRSAITQLQVRTGHSRGRNALIGAGIGAAIGLTFALIEHSRCKGEWLCGVEFALPILTTPAGALVGVAIPGNRRWVDASSAAADGVSSHTGVQLAWSVTF